MTTHAVIYDRGSTENQKDNWSRVDAKDQGIAIAEKNGYTYDYVKEIGSGTTLTNRPEMLRILDRIADGEIQAIIVQDLDRLARPIDRAVYETIRSICLKYHVIIHTHSGTFNFADDDNDFMADIQMAVAKKEVKGIRKRLKRGRDARAKNGGYFGRPPIGYEIQFVKREDGRKPVGKLVIDPSSVKTVERIFELTIKHHGNLSEVRRQMRGYRGRDGKPFSFNALKLIVTNQIYAGLMQFAGAETPIHRPDLQIIPMTQFQEAQDLVRRRSRKHNFDGKRGRHMFTGYVMCGICGGKMVARKIKGSIIYTCVGRADESCKNGKSYGEKLILPPVIDILANIINRCWGLDQTLNAAANQFGKTVNEEALEAAIQGEMAVVQAGKERLVQALVDGIFTQSEVSAKMEELRQKERDLTVELASISEKVKLRDSFVAAIEVLKRKDVRVTLRALADNEPLAFRQLLGIIIKPNSLRVRTFRKPGTSNQWVGEVISYELSDPIREFSANLSFSNVIL